MFYQIPYQRENYYIGEPTSLKEIDLVQQWLEIPAGTELNTIDHQTIVIINTGQLNRHEGPDIKNAILIIDGKIQMGSVECHLESAGWFQHGHQADPNYKSVILHVIRAISGNQANPIIPTVIIKPTSTIKSKCNLTNNNKDPNIEKTILNLSYHRWSDKVNNYSGLMDNPEVLFRKLLQQFFRILGVGGNEESFENLAQWIDYKPLLKLPTQQSEMALMQLSEKLRLTWVKRGIRPAQQPQNRMKLAVELIRYLYNIANDAEPNIQLSVEKFREECSGGRGVQTELIGNVLLPYIGANALYNNDLSSFHGTLKLWQKLKIPYGYHKYIKRFGSVLTNTKLRSFRVLQGLIQLDHKYCSKNLCHNCPLKSNNVNFK